MNILPKRPLVSVSDQWSIPQVRTALAAALDGSGPALVFSPITFSEVDSKVAIILTTTGSTGKPKEIQLSAEALIKSAELSNNALGAKPGDTWSLHLPLTHIAGINVLLRSLVLGTEIATSHGTFTAIVPTQLHRALNGDVALLKELQSCKAVLVGGAASSQLLLEEARKNSIHVVTTYGSTETSGGCIYNNQPLPEVEVRISALGLLEISSPTLAEGVAQNGWYTTSDLAEIRDGKVFIQGRADDVIISGGENISLSQVEATLATISDQIMAIGVPSAEWGEELVILTTQVLPAMEIKKLLVAALGKFATPKSVLKIDAIPLKGIGKPDRARALELYLARNEGR